MQTILASGQNRNMWFLTEDGLYEVLMQSRKLIEEDKLNGTLFLSGQRRLVMLSGLIIVQHI